MNPPPPILPAAGHTTASARPVATAASIALPPRLRMLTPTCDAISLTETTIPCRARTGGRDAANEGITSASASTAATRRLLFTKTALDKRIETRDVFAEH